MALAIGAAALPWRLDPGQVAERLDAAVASYGYHFARPTSATLRLFPLPVLDVFGAQLLSNSGETAFRASTAAVRLSALSLLAGKYVLLQARLKDPVGELDLDALAGSWDSLVSSPPVAALQARGGRVRVRSARLGIDETVTPVSASYVWLGADMPLRVKLGGVWRGQWTTVDASIAAPSDLAAGRSSDVRLELSAAGAKAALEGPIRLGSDPAFSGRIAAESRSLDEVAGWAGLPTAGFPDAEAAFSGKASLTPAMLSLEEGRLTYKGQIFDGGLGLQRGPQGWAATATLAAETLDLAPFLGPPPQVRSVDGGWSHSPIASPFPGIDLDMRLSAATAIWGGLTFRDAAVAAAQRGDEIDVKILDAGFAGGTANGEIVVKDCARRCSARTSLTLAGADADALGAALGKPLLKGVCTVDLDVQTYGETPAALIASADGELAITVRDGAIQGVNFEEALRRSQRRALDLSRDFLVGQTGFRKLDTVFDLRDGVARSRQARLTGPGVFVTGEGEIGIAAQTLQADFEARQADALGHVSADGALMQVRIGGPWPYLTLEGQPRSN